MWSLRPWNPKRKDFYLDPFGGVQGYHAKNRRERKND